MTNRVLFGALDGGGFGLRVSRQGFDVTNAALTREQLVFDSRWIEATNVFMYGSMVWDSSTSYPSPYFHGMRINYGTTFSSPPCVFGMIKGDDGNYYQFSDLTTTNWLNSLNLFAMSTTTFAFFQGNIWQGNPFHYVILRNSYG